MKTLIFYFLFVSYIIASPMLIVAPPNGHVTISWDYNTNCLSTNLWFNIYESTNMDIPLTNWNCLTNIIGTNLSANLDIVPGQHFFVMTSSNFWGETSITSNLVSTPPLPLSINDSVTIHKSL